MTTKLVDSGLTIGYCNSDTAWSFPHDVAFDCLTGRIKYKGAAVYFELELPYGREKGFWGWLCSKKTLGTIILWREESEIDFWNEYEEVIVECTPVE